MKGGKYNENRNFVCDFTTIRGLGSCIYYICNNHVRTRAVRYKNSIIIKNANGDEIYMQKEQKFDLQSQWDEPGADYNLYDGVVVYVKEAGSAVFKEKYIMSNFMGMNTDIGFIDRENGTTLQNYASTMTTFDTQGAIDADNYFNEKEGNLDNSYNDANNYYNEKEGNLKDAYTTADGNFRYMNQWEAGADADANIDY